VGSKVGFDVGFCEGFLVGSDVGNMLGANVGLELGTPVGLSVRSESHVVITPARMEMCSFQSVTVNRTHFASKGSNLFVTRVLESILPVNSIPLLTSTKVKQSMLVANLYLVTR